MRNERQNRKGKRDQDKNRRGARLNSKAIGTPNNTQVKKRAFFMLLLLTVPLLFLVYRVGFIQFVNGSAYQKMAYNRHTSKQTIEPKRGSIYDRNGQALAVSTPAETISVNPSGLREEVGNDNAKLKDIADFLSPLIGMDPADIMTVFAKDSQFEYLKKKVDPEIGGQISTYAHEKELSDIYIDNDSKRVYPNGSLASHVIGFTGTDGQGLSGIELSEDSVLKGDPGKILNEVDVLGHQIKYDPQLQVEAVDGYDITLTIDSTIQYMAEQALKRAIVDDKVKMGASALVMDPNTGEVLAMASYPDFDPNKPDAKPDSVEKPDWKGFKDTDDTKTLYETVFRNKTVMDTYEPGSTFKAITAAASLEEGVVAPDTPVVDRPLKNSGWTIDCWLTGGHGAEDFTHAVYNSCNPVFANLALSLGIDKFYSYVKMFGFMNRTGIEVSGEPTDEEYRNLWHKNPTEIDLAVAGFGQRFQVSPIQMATAYCAIANGGKLIKPTLIKQIADSDGGILKRNEPQVIREVISEETSARLRSILEGVVSKGTGKNAYVSGYRIAGKTGTAETLQTKSEGRYIVSFAAMAPADKPRIVVLVVLDDPQVDMKLRSGSVLAAPIAGKLSADILEYLKVSKEYNSTEKDQITHEVLVPDISNLSVQEAAAKLKAFDLDYRVDGADSNDDAVVYSQAPKADTSIPQSGTVILYTDKAPKVKTVAMPNLINKTIDEATQAMKKAGLNIRITGDGEVVKQEYPAGTPLSEGDTVDVEFVVMIKD